MLEEIRLEIADFLNINLLFFNLWHVVHFAAGAIVLFLILRFFKKQNRKEKIFLLLMFLALYEVFEFAFIVSGSGFFRAEIAIDVFFDLLFGMIGGLLFLRFRKK